MLKPEMLVLASAIVSSAAAIPAFPSHLVGNASAVYSLLERVIPGSSSHFQLSLKKECPGVKSGTNCFTLADNGNKTAITGTTASELTGGLGVYLREYCGMTFGWVRGGGSNVFLPNKWPEVGSAVSRARSVPYSHVTQVCTHSYTLVWHDWTQWERFIDWMALAGHNSIVAPTGQEEVQYRVLTEHFGVSDIEMRNWTNGPGFLTWSRGQNSHGNGVAGPLPRSFMKSQWSLQKQILARYRSLGIVGHLPAFGGYAPWAVAVAQNATGRIAQGVKAAADTAWIDGRDPLYTSIADAWVRRVIADFGSDHVWQMDAFFANGSSWGIPAPAPTDRTTTDPTTDVRPRARGGVIGGGVTGPSPLTPLPPCVWSAAINNTYLAGYVHSKSVSFSFLKQAQDACLNASNDLHCGGVVSRNHGAAFEIRAGIKPLPVPASDAEASYVVTNRRQCDKYAPNTTALWHNRSAAAYGAVARADGPEARWLYQGYALTISGNLGSDVPGALQGFTSAIPQGQFIVMDMSAEGTGQWRDKGWKGKWGLPFIWTTLHTYGGAISIKGNLSEINALPYAAPPLVPVPQGYDPRTQAVGVGYTPEGLDQNPAYYELLQEAAFRAAPVPDVIDWLVERAHRRYGLAGAHDRNPEVAAAWIALGNSGYAQNQGVSDGTGVHQNPWQPRVDNTRFESDLRTPTRTTCLEWDAWGHLNSAAPAVAATAAASANHKANHKTNRKSGAPALPEPFVYDLVNTAREVLAQLSTPLLLNFSAALAATPPLSPSASPSSPPSARVHGIDPSRVSATSALFISLLSDLDRLLATDAAFMLGPWLVAARRLGGVDSDCGGTRVARLDARGGDCADFMEWNARAQLTTWYPTLSADQPVPGQQGGRDHDYAGKQWSGLVSGFYVPRAEMYRDRALRDAQEGASFNVTAVTRDYARMTYEWQTNFTDAYPVEPVDDAVKVSIMLREKWAPFFSACS